MFYRSQDGKSSWQRSDLTEAWKFDISPGIGAYGHAAELEPVACKAAVDNFFSKTSPYYVFSTTPTSRFSAPLLLYDSSADAKWDSVWWKNKEENASRLNNQMENMRVFDRAIRAYSFTTEDKEEMHPDPCLWDVDYLVSNCDHVFECWLMKRFFKKTVLTATECERIAYYQSESNTNVRKVGQEPNWDLYFASVKVNNYDGEWAAGRFANTSEFCSSTFSLDQTHIDLCVK